MQSRVWNILRRINNKVMLIMNKCNAAKVPYILEEMFNAESSANSHPDCAVVLDQVEREDLEPGKEPARD